MKLVVVGREARQSTTTKTNDIISNRDKFNNETAVCPLEINDQNGKERNDYMRTF